MDQRWIFDLVERDPELLLTMSEEDFRAAMLEAGVNVDELNEQFGFAVSKLLAERKSGRSI